MGNLSLKELRRSQFLQLKKFSLNISILVVASRVNLLYPKPSFFLYTVLYIISLVFFYLSKLLPVVQVYFNSKVILYMAKTIPQLSSFNRPVAEVFGKVFVLTGILLNTSAEGTSL